MDNIKKAKESVWDTALSLLVKRLPPHAINTWFAPIVPISINSKKISLSVPSQFFSEWIESHYGDLLLGPMNSSYCHIWSNDHDWIYFNTGITVDTGLITSYDENLILRRNHNDTDYNQIEILDNEFKIKLNNTNRFNIDTDGNVGIGITNPSQLLNISGGHILIDH